ncbi:hypothetical protein [Paracidovorax sp. MALMAid1276]|uniref:hypothetical protein n=1 Tax=Paracidovorax sp. MALMAid1276 TaxID=3411631 RepID=UPI003B994E66
MKKMTALGGLFAVLALSACGGGSDAEPVKPPPATVVTGVEGFWSGTTSNALNVQGAVLENGETWSIVTDAGGIPVGFSQGTVQTSAGDLLNGSAQYLNAVDNFAVSSRKTESVSYTGRYSVRDAIETTTTAGVKFWGRYGTGYEQIATVSQLVGAFSGTGIANQIKTAVPITVSVTTGGLVSIPNYPGCSIRGTAVPRASGRNVFDLPLTFSGTDCPVASGSVVQSVVFYNEGTRALQIMGFTTSKSDSFVFTGTKS